MRPRENSTKTTTHSVPTRVVDRFRRIRSGRTSIQLIKKLLGQLIQDLDKRDGMGSSLSKKIIRKNKKSTLANTFGAEVARFLQIRKHRALLNPASSSSFQANENSSAQLNSTQPDMEYEDQECVPLTGRHPRDQDDTEQAWQELVRQAICRSRQSHAEPVA